MTVLEITDYGRNTLRRRRLEARLLDAYIQPSLAPAYELDRGATTATLVTELLPDITIDHLVGISPLPAAAALYALRDVAGTLHAMHECGLVHGDLRAAGVLILPDGRAALARPDTAPPASGTSRGSAVQADSYGFAVLAFELLTAIHPLDPSDATAMTACLGMLPRRAATVLRRALTAAPARRPLPLDLVDLLEGVPAERWASNQLRPVLATPPPPPPPSPPPASPEAAVATPEVQPLAPPDEVVAVPVAPPPAPPVPEVAVPIAPPLRRKSLGRRIFERGVVLVGLLTVAGAGGAGAWLLFTPASTAGDPVPPPQVRRVSLTITPPQVTCPHATLHFATRIETDGGTGPLEVRLRLPDGTIADTETVMADPDQTVLSTSYDLTLSGRRHVLGPVTAIVSPGGARDVARMRYACGNAPWRASSGGL